MKRINTKNINTKDFWNANWKAAPDIDWQDRRYTTIANYVRDGDVVLDIGCGRGEQGATIKQIRPEASVFGTDVSDSGIEYAKFNFPGITWETASAYDQPYPDSFFDTVLCGEVIEHLSEPQKLVDECYRLLKNGGRLILSCPYKDSMSVPEHIWAFDGEDLVDMCKKFRKVWYFPWASGRRLVDINTGKTTHKPGVFDILFVIAIK